MPAHDIRDIKPRDTVALEANISRFWPKNPDTGVSRPKAFLKIKSISLVYAETRISDDDEGTAKDLSDDDDFSL